ncbi:hypothetical protein DWV07_04440 [Dickeya zeae]|nr:hypothetical protein DWV07_04440 [Dickeya zeae]
MLFSSIGYFGYLYPSYFKLQVRWLPLSPQSLTYVSSWGFDRLPPSCNSNYFGYTLLVDKLISSLKAMIFLSCKSNSLF